MAPLHGTTNPTDARKSGLSSAWRTHAKSVRRRVLAGRFIAVRPISPRRGQVSKIWRFRSVIRPRRLDHQRIEYVPRLLAVVGVSAGDHHPQGHAPAIRRQVYIGAGLAAIYRAGSGLLAPFFEGCLDPSRQIWSQLIPWRHSYRWAKIRQASWKTPRSSHSLKRFEQVLSEGNPLGIISQGIPVTRTYSTPCKQSRSLQGGRPFLTQTTFGNSGSNTSQISSGSFRAMSLSSIGSLPTYRFDSYRTLPISS